MVVRDCVHYHASGLSNYSRLVAFPMRPRFRNVNERIHLFAWFVWVRYGPLRLRTARG